MKDWLINKLGGHTRSGVEKIILEKEVIHKRHESDMKVLEEVSKTGRNGKVVIKPTPSLIVASRYP